MADVRVDVLALQGQDLINSLTKGDFTVTDEGQPQSIIAFAHGDESLNLILLFDISGSMQSHIEQIAKTARQALGHLRPGDRVAIMVFAKTSAVHQDFSDNLAETARQISSAVRDHDVGVTTQINAAVVDAARYMQAHADSTGRRAILILSDNCMYPNPDFTPANVFHLAEETGGEWVKAEHADASFNDMIQRIRSRYMLVYHAPEAAKGTFRRIAVTLTGDAKRRYPFAELRARSGYYAE